MMITLKDGTGLSLRYLVKDVDRHGNIRVYVRRHGRKVRLRELANAEEFMAAYRAALVTGSATEPVKPTAAAPESLHWLVQRYYQCPEFRGLHETTRAKRRAILDGICLEHGTKPFARMEAPHVRTQIRDPKAETPEAANGCVKALRQVFKWAVEVGYTNSNPARDVPMLRRATRHDRQYRTRRRPISAPSLGIGTAVVANRQRVVSRAILSHSQPRRRALLGASRLNRGEASMPAQPQPANRRKSNGKSTRLSCCFLTGGDVAPNRRSGKGLFGRVASLFAAADIAFVNLEHPLSHAGRRLPGKPLVHRGPPDMVDGLLEAGLDAVNLANNHIFDFGEEALFDTFDLLGSALAHRRTLGGGNDNHAIAIADHIIAR